MNASSRCICVARVDAEGIRREAGLSSLWYCNARYYFPEANTYVFIHSLPKDKYSRIKEKERMNIKEGHGGFHRARDRDS